MMLRSLIPLAALVLTACSSGPIVGIYPQVLYEDVRSNYYPEAVSLFGAAGGPTEIYGTPSDGGVPTEIVAGMRLPHFTASRKITAVEPEYPNSGLRLILVFAPQTTALAEDACKGGAKGGTAGAQMKVWGVFCRGSRPMSEAVVYAEGSPGVGNPALAGALNALVGRIMPAVDPNNAQEGVKLGD